MSRSEPIRFARASIYARKIRLEKRPIRFTEGHRGMVARAWQGYVIIERRWYPRGVQGLCWRARRPSGQAEGI